MRNFTLTRVFNRLAMNTEEQDDLWRLLGHAKAPAVSPFFSRNVLRAIREEEQEKPSIFVLLRWRWLTFSATACGLLVAAGLTFHHNRSVQAQTVTLLAQQVSTSPDYQVINHLDELLASEETSVWLEK